MMLGVDLGGSKVSAALLASNGKVISKVRHYTPRGKQHILAKIGAMVSELDPERKIKRFGLGIPGLTDSKGKIVFVPNLPELKGVNIRKELEKITKRKVVVENDAKCFALAEHRLGAAKGKRHVIGIIIGTGVGCGIIIDKEIYSGASGGAGELGHTYLMVGDKVVEAEDLISGPALLKEYEKLSGHVEHELSNLHDKHFHQVYKKLVFHISILCANLINIFNPEAIVFGGGVSNVDFYADLQKAVKKNSVPRLHRDCKILKNKLGDDAGIIGAALLAK